MLVELGLCWVQRTYHALKYFLAYLDKICEVQLVIFIIDKLQAHDIERSNRKLKMANEAN